MRTETDSMGTFLVPDGALYGASTQRAVENFSISGRRLPHAFIASLARIKAASARANETFGLLSSDKSRLIQQVAGEIEAGKWESQFPVDVFQTGSGTSTNTNMNEVISNRASQLTGHPLGSKNPLHPNDDVNLGQSSNDVIPSALHMSVALVLRDTLRPALIGLGSALEDRSTAFRGIVKVGRTHLMDATPLTLGQELSGYAAQASKAVARVDRAVAALAELAIGGTAVGTGLNTHARFGSEVCSILSATTGLRLREAENHFEAQACRDDIVEVAGQLTAVAAALTKIANDLRLLASGPRAGLQEIRLPSTQPGSSVMPGKVNPVMCEMLIQAALYAQGLCHVAALCGREGHFELNATLPLLAHCLHDSIHCLSNATRVFAERCVTGIEADEARCRELVDRSLMLATALNPHIGYDAAASVAKQAFQEGRTLRDVILSRGLLSEEAVDRVLDPGAMLTPRR
ncbi:MAG: class II fumarate hydratase [Opitutaceae bacterium]|nr:class II fumarate hydratase [Opitutaceae bacterium]